MGNIEIPDWDSYFMNLAYNVASRSKDANTHIGAVIVGPDKEIRSTGCNSFVRRLNDNVPARQERPEKYYWFEHAERNSIYNAALAGISTKNCKMYTNGIPCMDCARGVVQSGIIEVIVDKGWNEENSEKWDEHAKRSLEMFKEVGINVRYWEGKISPIVKYKQGKII